MACPSSHGVTRDRDDNDLCSLWDMGGSDGGRGGNITDGGPDGSDGKT